MCLLTDNNKTEKSDSEIECFKVLEIRERAGGDMVYCTPFMGVEVGIEIICGDQRFIAKDYLNPPKKSVIHPGKYVWDSGLIHTYSSFEEALLFSEGKFTALFRCVIPADTEYVAGIDTNGFHSYASRSIIFKEKLF